VEQSKLREKIELEMRTAREARLAGNEGRARVCARRAAGHAVRAFRDALGSDGQSHSAYVLLRWLAGSPDIEQSARECAERLAARVTPEHDLPYPQDPVEDAARLVQALTGLDVSLSSSTDAGSVEPLGGST
jgi:HEPN domain-containing protein